MAKQKTHHDVKGWQTNCVGYEMCPLCYGCRAYDSSRVKCYQCIENKKRDVCNTTLHKTHLIGQMVKREIIKVKEVTA